MRPLHATIAALLAASSPLSASAQVDEARLRQRRTETAQAVVLALAAFVGTADAAPALRVADRLHAAAVESFRQARFPEAYGRFIALADAGHAPSARIALWMWQNGPELFGKDWDSTPEQLEDWARLAGVPAPVMQPRVYGRFVIGPRAQR